MPAVSSVGRGFSLIRLAVSVSACDAEHYRQPLMSIAQIARPAAIGLPQFFDSIGEVAAVVVVESRIPHDGE